MPETKEWERLAALMRRRRIGISGHSNRSRFLRDHGYEPQSSPYRLVSDLENCKRTSFERGTFDLVEHLYQWQPGSVAEVLRGGEPMPMPDDDVDVSDERPLAVERAELRRLVDLVPEQDIPRVRDYLRGVVEQV